MQYYNFGNTFKCLRQSAVKILDYHINAAKRQLSTTLSVDDSMFERFLACPTFEF